MVGKACCSAERPVFWKTGQHDKRRVPPIAKNMVCQRSIQGFESSKDSDRASKAPACCSVRRAITCE